MKASKKQIEILKRIVKEANPSWVLKELYAIHDGNGYIKVAILISRYLNDLPTIINLSYHDFKLTSIYPTTTTSLSFLNKIANIEELRNVE